ncbi:MAG: M15 family metallopeptidase [Acidobacteriota bacterium]
MKELIALFVLTLAIMIQPGSSLFHYRNSVQPFIYHSEHSIYKWPLLDDVHLPERTKTLTNVPLTKDTLPVPQPVKTRSNVQELIYTHDEPPVISRPIVIDKPNGILALVNKTHSLPFDYVPADLIIPGVVFVSKEPEVLRRDAGLALQDLFKSASESGITYYCLSGYRSYSDQKKVYANQISKRGEFEANQVSALPGQSEHQTGLAADITTDNVGRKLVRTFGRSNEGLWLKEHAHEFGFIMRYPHGKEDITQYYYEPWHIR